MSRDSNQPTVNPGSFRDPCGFVFTHEGRAFRQINRCYKDTYRMLMNSGLYQALCDQHLLIPHQESDHPGLDQNHAFTVIIPDTVPFISYPYEWCYSQLKDAALALLRIQEIALSYGMTLKDCNAFNMQFVNIRPVLIDTLSFEPYTAETV